MKILGVHEGHNASASLLEDGEIRAAISEERINRIKYWEGVPEKAVIRVLQITDTKPEDVDMVVFSYLSEPINMAQISGEQFSFIVYGFNLAGKVLPGSLMSGNLWVDPVVKLRSALRDKKRIFSFFEGIGIPAEKIVFADHHLCHTYTVMSNPWGITDNALLINIDGAGDGYCSTVNVLEDGAVRNIEKTNAYNSIGLLYSEATQFLNMRPLSHEYKVMGLAAYSREENYRHICSKLSEKYMRINQAHPMRFENIAGCTTWGYRKKFRKDFAGERFDNFAGGIQRFTEEMILKFVKNCMEETKKETVFLSGGVFMNVKVNMRLMYETDIKRLFVFPSCGDESNSIGACNYGYHLLCKQKGEMPEYGKIKSIYWGDEYSNDEIKEELDNYKDRLRSSFIDDIDYHVAEELAKGGIVARFSGRMEFGARALGNRSILAHPASGDVPRKINRAVKMRDFWMPFAGTILDEDRDTYLLYPESSRTVEASHMMLAFKTKERAKEDIISAIHPYDLTCRPQILEKDTNPGYYSVIKRFRELTGIGALLNTSFNIHGDPMVRSPRDALETLLKSDLKALAIGNYYVEKK